MGEDMQCHTGLGLGIGEVSDTEHRPNKSPVQLDLFLSAWMKEEDGRELGIPTREEERNGEIPRLQRAANEEVGGARKKLRLTKEQSTILEERFRVHNTLNQNQKQHLAERLNLRPRQVEVWFQNRRARTKLKQTEVDCDFLKKCCESLSDENRRLKRELQELKGSKPSSSVYVQLPKATTLRLCPSCESIALDHSKSSTNSSEQIGSPEVSVQALRLSQ